MGSVQSVQIVTDSTADLPPEIVERLAIHVVPMQVHFGKEILREGIDIDAPHFIKRLRAAKTLPTTAAPSAREFETLYGRLVREHEHILSIHVSAKLSQALNAAEKGALPFIGRKKICVMDSQSTSRGLGYLTIAAAEAARQGASLDELIKLLRTLIPHVYLVFFVETLDYLNRGGRLAKVQTALGSMLNIRPLLAIEDGEIIALDKMRTRQRALEKLCEFTLEFSKVRKITILHGENDVEVLEIRDKISEQLPEAQIELAYYGPTLASHVGPDAVGAVIFEEP